MFRRAVILAGGLGTRLRPYTYSLPKPLMPIGKKPILEIIIMQLANYEFSHITLAVNHQADIIKAYFGDGSKWGLKIDYSLEETPLSTIAPLRLIHDLPDNFLLMNGDILTDINFGKFYEEHIKNKKLFTISSKIRKQKIDFGVLNTNKKNELIGFQEKPINTYQVSMGIYMLSKEIIELIPKDEAFGFDQLMNFLISINRFPNVIPFEGYWLDIGRPEDYATAIEKFEDNYEQFTNA